MKDKNGRNIEVGDCAFSVLGGGIMYDYGVFDVVEIRSLKTSVYKIRTDAVLLKLKGGTLQCWQNAVDIIAMTEEEAVFELLKNDSVRYKW